MSEIPAEDSDYMLMRIRDMIKQTNDHSVGNSKDRWQRRLAFAAMIVSAYMLAFDTVPGLARRDIHEMPDGLLYLYFLIYCFTRWRLWLPGRIAANILTIIMALLLTVGTIFEITINRINPGRMTPYFLMMLMYLIIAVGAIWDRRSPDKVDDQESSHDASGER